MVRSTLSVEKALSMLAASGLLLSPGCKSKDKVMTPDLSAHRDAIERTASVKGMAPGSREEEAAIKRFNDFYAVYSEKSIRSGVRKLYAANAWFGDPFHMVEGIENIEHYFLLMAEPVEECTFSVDSMQRSGNDYYARWTMLLDSKAVKGDPIEAVGVSHVRFNAEGLVIFQQDYWDTSAMLDRLPVVGYWTRLVKKRIAKDLEK
jgi:hypothetical protein